MSCSALEVHDSLLKGFLALSKAFEGCLSKLGLIQPVIALLQLSHSRRRTDAERQTVDLLHVH